VKHIVSIDDYCERDIKPVELIDQYIDLVAGDVKDFFTSRSNLSNCNCPGCHGNDFSSSFKKFGMDYLECSQCGTLRISPRPDDECLRKYYGDSRARKFWRDKIFQSTESNRKDIIIKPRIEWISDSTLEYCSDAVHIADFNTNQPAVLKEFGSLKIFKIKSLIEPYIFFEHPQLEGLQIIEDCHKSVGDGEIDVITLFEVADRTADVDALFDKVGGVLKKGGLCFMTNILISGFDLLVLWDKAKNIFPPDRLNIFTHAGLQMLFERHGFKCLEFSTPGNLDLAIIESAFKERPDLEISRFVRRLLHTKDENTKKDFQAFLQMHLMSSYARILIQKK